ncbi:MAG: hypothetical protein OEV49_04305 [candidate division Zixibacteria bacterium]|nr:hypothetical protein [candidate division Zixibacteria bacterium]MDH3936183.1 hypothetical protein [candidate division Zixibacteria bacterium]MDH4032973.1 hypothetical protein [candidate division Zixibacteria bacterium]
MAETIRIVKYYYATVGDRPGEARRLMEHLSERGVNLLAFTAFPIEGNRSQLDFVPDKSEELLAAAADAGVDLVGPKEAILIQGDDRAGALHDHHLKLANANINVHAANGVACGSGRFGYILWVAPSDVKSATEVLMGSETDGPHGTLRPGGVDW